MKTLVEAILVSPLIAVAALAAIVARNG